MNSQHFIDQVNRAAMSLGYPVAPNRNGQLQIDFGHKKIHSGHLEKLYPAILEEGAHLPSLIEAVAPGRPCAHRPMREIVARLKKNRDKNH